MSSNAMIFFIPVLFQQNIFLQCLEVGHFAHKSENDLVCWTTCGKIPFFNAPVYFENKEQVGKIDEIFGSPQESVSILGFM
jgi:H/ACA ribonucleoprotein complex subunit 1